MRVHCTRVSRRDGLVRFLACVAVWVAVVAPSSAADSRPFRVLTWNVWGLPRPFLMYPSRFEILPAKVASVGADVVFFQEAFTDLAAPLAQIPGFPFHAWGPPRKWDFLSPSGLLIISRWPIVEIHQHIFSRCGLNDCVANKGVIHARVRLEGVGDIDIYDTHMDASSRDGLLNHQVGEILEFISATRGSGPLILAGDFNFVPESTPYRVLKQRSGYRDAAADSAASNPELPKTDRDGFTYDPRRNPHAMRIAGRRRIDYVWLADGWDAQIRVVRTRLVFDEPIDPSRPRRFHSDHFGLLAELLLVP